MPICGQTVPFSSAWFSPDSWSDPDNLEDVDYYTHPQNQKTPRNWQGLTSLLRSNFEKILKIIIYYILFLCIKGKTNRFSRYFIASISLLNSDSTCFKWVVFNKCFYSIIYYFSKLLLVFIGCCFSDLWPTDRSLVGINIIIWICLLALLTATLRICWLPRFPSCWTRALNSSVFSSGNWGTRFSKRDFSSERLQPAPTQTPADKPGCSQT